MTNPAFLVCDADSTIQLLSAEFLEPLKTLKARYGVQPVVVEAVAIELRGHRRHSNVRPNFEKSVSKKLIVELTYELLSTQLATGTGPLATPGAVQRLWAAIDERAAKYELIVDRGEAHTFAAAIELAVPAMSNDASSLRTLRVQGLTAPSPVLRSFDIYVFGLQTGTLSVSDLGRVCGRLRQRGENVPSPFLKHPVDLATLTWDARLIDGTLPVIGARSRDAITVSPVPQAGPPLPPPAAGS